MCSSSRLITGEFFDLFLGPGKFFGRAKPICAISCRNAEEMLNEQGKPKTSHTTNKVLGHGQRAGRMELEKAGRGVGRRGADDSGSDGVGATRGDEWNEFGSQSVDHWWVLVEEHGCCGFGGCRSSSSA